MKVLLALLAGRRVSRAYRAARGWNDARDHGLYYVRGLAHGALATITAAAVLLLVG